VKTDNTPPPSEEDKNGGAILPLPHTSSWHSADLIRYRDKFTFFRYALYSGINSNLTPSDNPYQITSYP
jgi:hypothetical protein